MEVLATIVFLQTIVLFSFFLWVQRLETRLTKANKSIDELVEVLRTTEPTP